MSHQLMCQSSQMEVLQPCNEVFSTPWFSEALGIILALSICFAELGEIISVIEGINVLATRINLSTRLSGMSTQERE